MGAIVNTVDVTGEIITLDQFGERFTKNGYRGFHVDNKLLMNTQSQIY